MHPDDFMYDDDPPSAETLHDAMVVEVARITTEQTKQLASHLHLISFLLSVIAAILAYIAYRLG